MHYVLGVDNNNIYSLDIVIDIENKMTFVYIVAASVGSHCQSSPGLYRAAVVHCWSGVCCDNVSVVLWQTSEDVSQYNVLSMLHQIIHQTDYQLPTPASTSTSASVSGPLLLFVCVISAKQYCISFSLSVLMAIFPGKPGLAGLLKLRMMEVVVTTGATRRAKLQSNRQHQQTDTLLFHRPDVLCPTNSVKALKEN